MASKGGKPVGWVAMVGPDDVLDQYSNSSRPANDLPVKCKHCSFPDLDFVPKPYLLAKGFSSPAETWSAHVGNFLVQERVRRILELVAPKACDFVATAELKSKKPTPWFLAVPKKIVATQGLTLHENKRCSVCKEPKVGYWRHENEKHVGMERFKNPEGDIFKQAEWYAQWTAEDYVADVNKYRKQGGHKLMEWSERFPEVDPPTHAERWTRRGMDRELFFSVRLARLWKQAKVKGKLVVSWDFRTVEPTGEDVDWVEEMMALLAKEGLVDAPAKGAKKAVGKAGGDQRGGTAKRAPKKALETANKWLENYIRWNPAKKKPAAIDFAAVEKKHKVKLPKRYKDFITAVGSKSFKDVNDMEGSTTKVLPPKQLDFKDYRAGALEDTDEESAAVDGVMFATVDSGDCFVFDVSGEGDDYPVFFYNHELNMMEPWSHNFAGCIKRFVEHT